MKSVAREIWSQDIAKILGSKIHISFSSDNSKKMGCSRQIVDSQNQNPSESCIATDGYIQAKRFPGYKIPSLSFR